MPPPARLVQYGSKFVSWLLEQEGLGPELVRKLRELESSISTARKRELAVLSFNNHRVFHQLLCCVCCSVSAWQER